MAHAQPTKAPGSGWEGYTAFGGIMLVVAGAFHALSGLVGILNDAYWVVPSDSLVVTADYTAWGWAHLTLGAVLAGVGAGVLRGMEWARLTGVVLAVVSALVNLAFLAAFPVWSAMVIVLDVLVIHSLVAHGSARTT
jgi:hypothetical protein